MTTKRAVLVMVALSVGGGGCNQIEPRETGRSASSLTAQAGTIGLTRPKALLSAVFYYPWFAASKDPPTDCGPESTNPWCCSWHRKQGDKPTDPNPRPPRPVLGLYGSDDETVIAKHMDWLVDYGVDVVAIEWNGNPHELPNIDLVIKAINARNLKFVIVYDLGIRLEVGNGRINLADNLKNGPKAGQKKADVFVGDFQDFAKPNGYFDHPKYLKFRNKPVTYVYITRALNPDTAPALIESTFNGVHAAVGARFDGLYLVADHLLLTGTRYDTLPLMRPSAVTAFHPIGFTDVVPEEGQTVMEAWTDVIGRIFRPAKVVLPTVGRIDLNPGVFVQYDHNGVDGTMCKLDPRNPQAHHLVNGEDWRYMLTNGALPFPRIAEETTVDKSGKTIVTTNTDTSIVWIYSFNEWGEGAGLEPLQERTARYPYGFGFELLEILKAVMNGWVDPPGVPCGTMGPGWYEANDWQKCADSCDTACLTKWDCNGELCYSPATGLNYCFKCPTTPVCGDGFCARGKGEQCYTCPQDCSCDGYTCGEMGPGWYYPDEEQRCTDACNDECQIKLDCKGKVCLAPHLQKAYCLQCPNLARCGDGACQPRRGENCETCVADCGTCVQPKTCGEMGLGWYEANQADTCKTACSGDCLIKFDCDGLPCFSPATGLSYCYKCPQLARCGDGACQGRIGERCDTCPADCGPCPEDDTDDGNHTNSCGSQGFVTQDECNDSVDCSNCITKFDCGGLPCEGGYCFKCD
jgi:hypothetical protein